MIHDFIQTLYYHHHHHHHHHHHRHRHRHRYCYCCCCYYYLVHFLELMRCILKPKTAFFMKLSHNMKRDQDPAMYTFCCRFWWPSWIGGHFVENHKTRNFVTFH